MRILLTALAFLLSLALIVPAMFFAALVLAGPHSDVLPSWLAPVALVAAWVAVIAVPTWAARIAWRRLGRKPAT